MFNLYVKCREYDELYWYHNWINYFRESSDIKKSCHIICDSLKIRFLFIEIL